MGPKIQWGWWLTPGEDKPITAVNRFRHDDQLDGLTMSNTLGSLGEGSATYEGDATGQYAVTGDSGGFTAKATLTAKFGAAKPDLSGSIHTFKGDDDKDRPWTVMLTENKATTNNVGDFANGETVWQGNEMKNGWNADMYNGTGDEAPDIILGDFRAESQGGRMVGVFGAEHSEPSASP